MRGVTGVQNHVIERAGRSGGVENYVIARVVELYPVSRTLEIFFTLL